jgi:hypothetical protein
VVFGSTFIFPFYLEDGALCNYGAVSVHSLAPTYLCIPALLLRCQPDEEMARSLPKEKVSQGKGLKKNVVSYGNYYHWIS